MKKFASLGVFIASIFAFTLTWAQSPEGYWKTIDDETGKIQSILKIGKENERLYGKIVKVFPAPGHLANEVCKACKGARHNQPIVSMVIMEGLKQDVNAPLEWKDGEIIDPRTGNTYHCNLRLSAKGDRLNVRGYIGVPLFGRTQTWVRVTGPEG